MSKNQNVVKAIEPKEGRPHQTTPEITNAVLISRARPYNAPEDKEDSLSDLIESLMAINKTLSDPENKNPMREAERLLMSQSQSLNALFCNLIGRAQNQTNIDILETFMKLALRSQNQCRATLETLSNIRNPPVVFAKTANIAQNQQINHCAPPAQSEQPAITHDQGTSMPVKPIKSKVTV